MLLLPPLLAAASSALDVPVHGARRFGGDTAPDLNATTESEIDAAFAQLAERQTGALLVDTDVFLFSGGAQLVGLAKRYTVSAIFDRRKYVEICRLARIYTGRILRGEKPADLTVIQSTKLQLIINLKDCQGALFGHSQCGGRWLLLGKKQASLYSICYWPLLADFVEEVDDPNEWGVARDQARVSLFSLKPALGRVAGSALPAFGGFGRWQRGGTRLEHQTDLSASVGRGAGCA